VIWSAVFGLIAALIALVLGTQAIRRRILSGRGARRIVRAVGASPAALVLEAVLGVGFAFQPDPGGYSRPAGPGIFGTVVALVILVGSLVFGASLSNLVSYPALYGWAWDSEILAGSGYGNIPAAQAAQLLDRDRDIAAWSGAYFDSLEITAVTSRCWPWTRHGSARQC
jgi:hypothetical protein